MLNYCLRPFSERHWMFSFLGSSQFLIFGCTVWGFTHRQWTTVRPSPHSLCHLCTWASRLRKAFLESGTSRYADQRRNWNWHTTSWPSWSFKYNKNIRCMQRGRTVLCGCGRACACSRVRVVFSVFFFFFFPVSLCVPVNTRVWALPRQQAGAFRCAHSADRVWDIWVCRCERCVRERSLCVHNLVL